ncbi:hypothetical protein F4820DRAFT_68886 [Hypoxylon rubiginosum]|uniref:Uncharacterized protein n=1 Tax=Hypoxylon rubiginosum TaxID=110542 RepID=A0ACB9YPV0_9PEZI|nr:hypothetical protein F4820DRAFT_68886 [Hypoxylon rubiginosum]
MEDASDRESDEDDNNNNLLYDIDKLVWRPQPIEGLVFNGRVFDDFTDTQLFLRLLTTLRRHPSYKGFGVLRNLTKRQYVLDSKLAESGYEYSLGEVIVIRTQWTSGFSGTCGTGDWAGDRFDIRSVQDFPVGWTDVSSETIALLANTWDLDLSGRHTADSLRSWVE